MQVSAEVRGAERERRAADLTGLARHDFDLAPRPAAAADRARLRAVHASCFERAFGPAILDHERAPGEARVRARGGTVRLAEGFEHAVRAVGGAPFRTGASRALEPRARANLAAERQVLDVASDVG